MKNRIYYPFILLITLLTAVSCENELPFNIKDNPPKLVMNALINADSLTNVLFLNFTGRNNATHVTNATVEVHINGKLSESLRPLPPKHEEDMQCRFNITSKFTPGDIVRIDARTDDGQYHAWAEVTVPQRPNEIANIDTLTVPLSQYNYTQNYLQYKISIKDRPNENNYYRLIVDKQMLVKSYNEETGEFVTQMAHRYNFISREDVVLTDGQPTTSDDEDNGMFDTVKNIYGVFDDTRFKDTSYIMTVYNQTDSEVFPEYGSNVNIDVFIRLLSITEIEYYYLKALNLIDTDAYDETINEPIKFPSNVQGGVGIVGVSTEVSKVIHISSFSAQY
ncbi:DUF4249 domain-containing protein [Bacteroides sp. GM023]|uniref:DUF4249 domain-containing protein n=1 Tax=Bacteroides sp. GM023 TaxID=2723058 RepID=UPI00168AADF3|nr:DUF4249 domain-containing protein [Bacteroides sp. GM023]MBD3592187.1 DUF4249 domain-containing protein [Bacteroides sp. GM023]